MPIPHQGRRRLIAWRLLIEVSRTAHRALFPGRNMGGDLDLLFTLGAVVASYWEGKRATVSGVSAYLELDRKTTERRLTRLTELGMVHREGKAYLPTERVIGTTMHVTRVSRLIQEGSRQLAQLEENIN